MIGLDTSFLIDFFKGEKSAVDWMLKNKDFICVSELVVYEFLCGNLNASQEQIFLGFVSQIPSLKFGRNASIESSKLFRSSKKSGQEIPHPDAMIAGSYLANNVDSIVTKNIKHSSGIKGLKIIGY